MTGNEESFFLKAKEYNDRLSENLYVVIGDPSLEVQDEAINQLAGIPLPDDSWQNVHGWLKDMLGAYTQLNTNSTFFIDCNPSFAAYTELAIFAAQKLIVPCTGDDSSARAIQNMSQLVYGIDVPDIYKGAMFASKMQTFGLPVPTIQCVIFNRSTQYRKKASKAFGANV